MKQMVANYCAALFLLVGQAVFATASATELMFDHPWLRATAPNAPMAAGYVQIMNMADADDRLLAASAEFAKAVEVHEVIKQDGVAKMRALIDGLVLPAGEAVTLQPGGYHLMFVKIDRQMQVGATHNVTLIFEKAGEQVLTFTVEKAGKRSHNHGGHDEGHDHGHDDGHDHGHHKGHKH